MSVYSEAFAFRSRVRSLVRRAYFESLVAAFDEAHAEDDVVRLTSPLRPRELGEALLRLAEVRDRSELWYRRLCEAGKLAEIAFASDFWTRVEEIARSQSGLVAA